MTRKRKILLVSSAFYPEISPRSFRATELAREFCRQGHNVTVISKFRNYDYSDTIKEFPLILKTWNSRSSYKILLFKNKPFSILRRKLSRILMILFEYPAIKEMYKVKKMLTGESGYDLMISFAVPYPVHWGVAWSRTKKHRIAATWVADCGDPFMGDILDSFRKPFYFGYLEKWFCRKADYISIPVISALTGYYPEFHGKILIIPQGFDFDLSVNKNPQKLNMIPEFAYAGGFLHGIRDPRLLMQYLKKIDLPFKFYVFTDNPELLNEYLQIMDGKLILSGYIQRGELMKRLAEMDFLINFDNNTKLNIPSKLIDYAILNRPVLNIDKDFKIENIYAFLLRDYSNRMLLPDPVHYHISNITLQFLGQISN